MIIRDICSYTRPKTRKLRKLYGKRSTKHQCKPNLPESPSSIVIPLHIYQVWHSKEIPKPVQESIRLIQQQNPEFEHHLYDEPMCRQFIQDHFPKKVVDAYDSIVPYAIKFDLWRYCILYKKGGIYLDSKYYGINGFKFIQLTDREYFCRERLYYGICNSILICKPKNKIILKCIHKVIDNVNKKYYGAEGICATGPLMMQEFFSDSQINQMKLHFEYIDKNRKYITHNHCRILQYHKDYKKTKEQRHLHWTKYWKEHTMYK
jgi:mannosyltransferase OCH1-like enzyme